MWREGWKAVAELSGADKVAHSRVERLLTSRGIDNAIEGSKAYYVFVPTPKTTEAIRLLHADAECDPYSIRVVASSESDDFVAYPRAVREPRIL